MNNVGLEQADRSFPIAMAMNNERLYLPPISGRGAAGMGARF